MKIAKSLACVAMLSALMIAAAEAQEGFGFGSEGADAGAAAVAGAEGSTAASPGVTQGVTQGVTMGGSVDFSALSFYGSADEMKDAPLDGAAVVRLDIAAKGSSAEAFARLKASKAILDGSPEDLVDEAYARVFLGPAMLEGGLIKLPWGKADSRGPLNVLNPMDLTDLTVTDEKEQRIARPMLHATLSLGGFTKLEMAFLPGFEGDRYAWEGRWTQKAIVEQKAAAYGMFFYGANPTANAGLGDGLYYSYYQTAWSTAYAAAYAQAIGVAPTAAAASAAASAAATAACAASAASIAAQAATDAGDRVAKLLDYPDTGTLEYAQGGLRFTTEAGPVDLGLQYFYGFLPRPAANADPLAFAANGYRVPVSYNRYHQAGADFAAALAGFAFRGEVAANLTEDLEGDDPLVYNPEIAFSAGFDRDLFAGLNLNIQYAGSFRLEDGGIVSPYDVEYGTDAFSSDLTAVLSQSLFKDALKIEAVVLWEIDDEDFLVLPSLAYAAGDAEIELSAGIFGGEADGPLGQYEDSSFVRTAIRYRF
jgi:hypothetical protein